MARKRVLPSGTVRWEAVWYDAGRSRRTKLLSDRKLAEVFEKHMALQAEHERVERELGIWVDRERAKITVADLMARWLDGLDASETTRKLYEGLIRNHVKLAFGDRLINSLEHGEVQAWATGLVGKLAKSTARRCVMLLSAALELAERDDLVRRNPARRIKLQAPALKRERRALTLEELFELAEAIEQRYRALVLMMGLGGLRPGEAVGLKTTDLDMLKKTVAVKRRLTDAGGKLHETGPKNGRPRTVHLPEPLLWELARHLEIFPPGTDGQIFTTPEGQPIHQSNFRSREWRRAVKASVGEPLTPYELRHAAQSLAYAEGVPAPAVAEAMGNSAEVSLTVYGHVVPGGDRRLAEGLERAYERYRRGTYAARPVTYQAERGV